MVARVENQNSKLDSLLWGLVAVLVTSAVAGQYYFVSEPLLWRIGAMAAALVASLALVSRTAAGRAFITFWQESMVELRRVVWPTRKETIQSTIAVIVMVFVMGIVLWSIDAVLIRVVAWMIKGAV